MLVLCRKVGEQICIGDGVVVTVLGVSGRRVRIGVAAPQDVLVDRGEVREKRLTEFPADCAPVWEAELAVS